MYYRYWCSNYHKGFSMLPYYTNQSFKQEKSHLLNNDSNQILNTSSILISNSFWGSIHAYQHYRNGARVPFQSRGQFLAKRKRKSSASVPKRCVTKVPKYHQKRVKSHHKDAIKTSITQRLRTDTGMSVGVTTTIKPVRLSRFTGSRPSH